MQRDISAEILRVCFGAVYKGTTPSRILTKVLEQIAFVQKDLDKTGDVDSAFYYSGMIDAYANVAQWIAPIKDDQQGTFSQLLDYVHESVEQTPKVS